MITNLITHLANFDKDALLFLNSLHAEALDPVMLFLTNKWLWIPMSILIAFFVIKKGGMRRGLIFILCIGLAVAISDQVCSSILRPAVERMRHFQSQQPYILGSACGQQLPRWPIWFPLGSCLHIHLNRDNARSLFQEAHCDTWPCTMGAYVVLYPHLSRCPLSRWHCGGWHYRHFIGSGLSQVIYDCVVNQKVAFAQHSVPASQHLALIGVVQR